MNIVFVTRESYDLPGARIRAYNFARELSGRGYNTGVLSYADHLGAKSGKEESGMSFVKKTCCNLKSFIRLVQKEKNVIILNRVNYHSFGPLLASLVKGNPLILDMDDWEIRENPRYVLGFYPTSGAEFLTRRIARKADFCIAASRYLKDYLSEFNKKTYYVPSCVDTEKFLPVSEKKDSESIKFCWVGTIHRAEDAENVKFIVNCFISLKAETGKAELHIIGDGIYGDDVRRHLSRFNRASNIYFVGSSPPDEIPGILRGMDVGLLPLTGETRFNKAKSPAKLFEYMASGKAVLASDVGEASAVIEDGRDGFLASGRNEFVEKMNFIINNIAELENIGKAAREKVLRGYSLKKAGDMLCSCFRGKYGF